MPVSSACGAIQRWALQSFSRPRVSLARSRSFLPRAADRQPDGLLVGVCANLGLPFQSVVRAEGRDRGPCELGDEPLAAIDDEVALLVDGDDVVAVIEYDGGRRPRQLRL